MILEAEGFTVNSGTDWPLKDMGVMEQAFPAGIFPLGAIHEFISNDTEQASASAGFIACLIGRLMQQKGPCLWVSLGKRLFPPSLSAFGVAPDRVFFVNLSQEKDALWVIEEALKCPSIAAVVGEIHDLDLTASRRLQLAVEQSHVTGFLHRYRPRRMNNMGCVARWNVKPMSSIVSGRLPGIGHPLWHVELQKIRNGKPGSWQMGWKEDTFFYEEQPLGVTDNVYGRTGTS
ncbi:hypothetical protein GCM10023231_18350 [Olivibacter ginsenosidimutans]|uniref:Error-prone repair protein ImuA n=2 Tax=Olivibacter ginsenosidimutans TaxID=1176537 RepID=A0ABP9B5S5_9SPHI